MGSMYMFILLQVNVFGDGWWIYIHFYIIFWATWFVVRRVQWAMKVLVETNCFYGFGCCWKCLNDLRILMCNLRDAICELIVLWVISCWKCYAKLAARGGVCEQLCRTSNLSCAYLQSSLCASDVECICDNQYAACRPCIGLDYGY